MEELISEALALSSDAIAYFVGRELARLYQNKPILEGAFCNFDLDGFAKAELCTTVGTPTVFNQSSVDWLSSIKPLQTNPRMCFITCSGEAHRWMWAKSKKASA